MNRYEIIQKQVYQDIEENCYGAKKLQAFSHLFGVSTLCLTYAEKFDLDRELCGIMGLLHDFSQFKNNNSFDHANRSSFLANNMLLKSGKFTATEIAIITVAIKNHSNKNKTDDKYSEFLKLCDVICSYLVEPDKVFSSGYEKYIHLAKEKQLI